MSHVALVRLVARQPLAVGAGPSAGNLVDTRDWVPGSTLRGALAAAWIRVHGDPRATAANRARFALLFEGEVNFGPLLPEGSSVMPLSVRRCKYRPEPGCTDVVVDLAYPGHGAPEGRCLVCGGPLDAARPGVDPRPIRRASTHVALTEDETASDGDLFTRNAVAAGTVFVGSLLGPADVLDELADMTADGQLGGTVWIGGRRSTTGRAEVRVSRPQVGAVPAPDAEPTRVVLRCLSPAVLVDDLGFPLARFGASALAAGGVPIVAGADAVVEEQWVRPGRWGGWHVAAGLPRPEELVLLPGATVVLRFREEVDADQRAALAGGIGLRRVEGFGAVEVNPGPWRPPVAAGRVGERADEEALVASAGQVAGLPERLCTWTLQLLRDQAMGLERPNAVREVTYAAATEEHRRVVADVRAVVGGSPEAARSVVELVHQQRRHRGVS